MLSGRENVNVAGARHGLRVCLANMCTARCETGSAQRLFVKLCTFSGGKAEGWFEVAIERDVVQRSETLAIVR